MLQQAIYNRIIEMGYKKENIVYEDYQEHNNNILIIIVKVASNSFMVYSAIYNGISNVLLNCIFITDKMFNAMKKTNKYK